MGQSDLQTLPQEKKVTLPTFAQEEYAEALVEQLLEAHNIASRKYQRAVSNCSDRKEMSRLIGEMKKILEDF